MVEDVTNNPRSYAEFTDERYQDILQAIAEKPERLTGLLTPLHQADIADLIERLTHKQREILVPHIPRSCLGDILAELDEGPQEHLVGILEPEEVVEAVSELESDDVVDIVQHLEEEDVNDETAAQIVEIAIDKQEKRLLKYAANTAGGLMQLEVVTATPEQKVSDVLRYLRKNYDDLPEDPGTVFVVNDRRKLLGTVSLHRLVACPLNAQLQTVMRENPITFLPDDPEEDVVKGFEKYNFHNCGVVNKRGHLLGRISVDDVLDTVIETHEREMKRAAGLDEREDLFAPVLKTTSQRLPWLVVNVFTAILASMVIAAFQGQIERMVALAVLMPIVASMGGNAGTQTMTVVVRGLATGQITMQNAVALLIKELTVGSLNGIFLAFFIAVGTMVIYQDVWLGLVIFIATIANHVFAAIAGHGIPLALKKLKYDPAVSSGVLVTTVTDVGGFFVFLGLAALLLL